MSCNHRHHPAPEILRPPQQKLGAHPTPASSPLHPGNLRSTLSLWFDCSGDSWVTARNTWSSRTGRFHLAGCLRGLSMSQCVSDFTPLYGGIILCCVCTHHLLFIHLSFGGRLDGVHLLATVNTAARNTWVPAFNSFRYMPRSRTAGSYGHSMFAFLRNWWRTLGHTDSQPVPHQPEPQLCEWNQEWGYLKNHPQVIQPVYGNRSLFYTHTHTHTHKHIFID